MPAAIAPCVRWGCVTATISAIAGDGRWRRHCAPAASRAARFPTARAATSPGGLCDSHWRQARTPRRFRWRRTPTEVQAMRQLHAQGVGFEELARRSTPRWNDVRNRCNPGRVSARIRHRDKTCLQSRTAGLGAVLNVGHRRGSSSPCRSGRRWTPRSRTDASTAQCRQ